MYNIFDILLALLVPKPFLGHQPLSDVNTQNSVGINTLILILVESISDHWA
ncbi:MAG: hypothetical protein AB2693_20470 [Candidatus Thiodiazotropha sp.]